MQGCVPTGAENDLLWHYHHDGQHSALFCVPLEQAFSLVRENPREHLYLSGLSIVTERVLRETSGQAAVKAPKGVVGAPGSSVPESSHGREAYIAAL